MGFFGIFDFFPFCALLHLGPQNVFLTCVCRVLLQFCVRIFFSRACPSSITGVPCELVFLRLLSYIITIAGAKAGVVLRHVLHFSFDFFHVQAVLSTPLGPGFRLCLLHGVVFAVSCFPCATAARNNSCRCIFCTSLLLRQALATASSISVAFCGLGPDGLRLYF